MHRQILINASGHETRVAILEDGQLVELMHDRPDRDRIVGDVYLGRVEAVLPGIQAAFVDIGTGKSGFLHASDVREADGEPDGRPAIQDVVSKGDSLLVQVTKESIGTKGPRVTRQISFPGRFLVYMPYGDRVGVSRKIEDEDERDRLRSLGEELLQDEEAGVIIRTVGEELNKKTFTQEITSLKDRWETILRRADSMEAPSLVYQEAKLTSGVIRDVFSEKVDELVVDSAEQVQEIKSYLGRVSPELLDRVQHYGGEVPIFDQYEVEDEIRRAFQREVGLESGGHIVIDHTEALVAVDVNTGRYTGKKDPKETILRTNLDAAREIARQLRLRDVGGIIVCDFIDMEDQEYRDRVVHQMKSHLGRDRARSKVFGISELGLLQMSRQRVRPSLFQAMTEPCPSCSGTGRVLSPETVVRRIERAVRRAGTLDESRELTVRVHPEVALYLLEQEPEFLKSLRREAGVDLDVRDDPLMSLDEYRLLAAPAATDVTAKYEVA